MAHEHWRYFLALEQDLDATIRYVEPSHDNFKTYSIELTRLLLGVCSEIDVVAKVLCQKIAPSKEPKNIDDYREIITSQYPRLHTMKVLVPRYSLQIEPWRDWVATANPGWWKDHNKVKHMRHEHFALANLENCLGATAGLFCLLLYLYQEDLFALRLQPRANLFALPNEPARIVTGRYELPDFPPVAD